MLLDYNWVFNQTNNMYVFYFTSLRMGAKFLKGYHFSLAQVYTTIILYLRNYFTVFQYKCLCKEKL